MPALRPLFLGLALLLTAGAAGLVAWSWLRASDGGQGALERLEVHSDVPDFAFVERSGRRISRADLMGMVWIANFIYTRCTETCPLQSARLAQLQAEFAGEPDLRLVSVTVDPDHDTPAVLSGYAERYRADPVRWLFLTGDKRAIYQLAREGFRLGVVDPDDHAQEERRLGWLTPTPALATHGSKGLIMHSPRLVLVDRQARIRAYHRPDDKPSLDRLRENLKILLRQSRGG
ncbi:MAG: SCO family protein [Candidatus Rokubacteria bacterium]|nr:SCO family protein [Candidatus Rokubacteria bacterium]